MQPMDHPHNSAKSSEHEERRVLPYWTPGRSRSVVWLAVASAACGVLVIAGALCVIGNVQLLRSDPANRLVFCCSVVAALVALCAGVVVIWSASGVSARLLAWLGVLCAVAWFVVWYNAQSR